MSVAVSGGSWWGPIHAFLAGTVLLAISGAAQMFTITWSSTVPPGRVPVAAQRWLIVLGVGLALIGVTRGVPALTWIGGSAAVAGVVMLGALIRGAVRRSLLRRFDLSSHFYLTAVTAGAVGVSLGTLMGVGVTGTATPSVRPVHAHLNLVGFVGLTIIGTLPTLLPTTAYSPAVSGREAVFGWRLGVAGVAAITLGLAWTPLVGLGTLLIATAGGFVLAGILWRIKGHGRRNLAFVQLGLGTGWLLMWSFVDGLALVGGATMTPFSGWTGAVLLAGIGQVLAGSLAYLVPVLKGSPFPENRRVMESRPWLPVVTLNAAGLALGAGLATTSVVMATIWAADFAMRVARVLSRRLAPGEVG